MLYPDGGGGYHPPRKEPDHQPAPDLPDTDSGHGRRDEEYGL